MVVKTELVHVEIVPNCEAEVYIMACYQRQNKIRNGGRKEYENILIKEDTNVPFHPSVSSLTWSIFTHFPPLGITAAHQGIVYNPASTALDPIAIIEAPTAAELAACHGVRNPPTAAVTQPH